MTKVATIASMVRTAAKSEVEFVRMVDEIFTEGDLERTWEFFDRLNIPRSQGAEAGLNLPLPDLLNENTKVITTLLDEARISLGVQRFLDRHERKIRWHATHPELKGTENVLLLFRAAMSTTNLRLARLKLLLANQDTLDPYEWAAARELMNRSYLSFRNFLNYVAADWIDAVNGAVPRNELLEKLGNFYELVDQQVRKLEETRLEIEERRMELTVIPSPDHAPVKPPIYFGGDLMGRGPWKQFWAVINLRAHHFRESLG
jgi:hypothetical protein